MWNNINSQLKKQGKWFQVVSKAKFEMTGELATVEQV